MEFNKSGINFENTYLSLDELMYTKIELNNNYKPTLEVLNENLAKELGINLEYLKSEKGLKLLSGNMGSGVRNTFAQAYSGHQFGYLNELGDGRAIILGEHITKTKNRYDIQLKGSGRTPYSRSGDGKATLYSMLREYIISEAMNSLNIPTSRSLAVVKTNELIQRNELEPGAVLSRVAMSHIRVGTFYHALMNGGYKALKELTDYTIKRHYNHLKDDSDKYIKFLREVMDRQAELIADWQSVGFIHGVLNTDNVLISGETIDYGPCAFIDVYDPKTVFSSIDRNGRYSYANQPYIGSWNLARFTESIMHLLDEDKDKALKIANTELLTFDEVYHKYYTKKMSLKLGITEAIDCDKLLVDELLNLMESHKEDFTNTFKNLTSNDLKSISMSNTQEFIAWYNKWQKRLISSNISIEDARKVMEKYNPVIIPRNNVIEDVLIGASKLNDYSLFNELLGLLRDPFNYKIDIRDHLLEPNSDSKKYITYCGT